MKLNNLLIYDGSKDLPYKASVEIQGSIIKTIQKDPFADGIDLDNRILCPGFIDIHAHSEALSRRDSSMAPRVLQGITTDISGNCGAGLWPWKKGQETYEDILGPCDVTWETFRDYSKTSRCAINQGFLQAHGPLRHYCMEGNANRQADDYEIDKMVECLEQSLDDGCFGFSTGLYYAPCLFSSHKELYRLLKAVAKKNRIFSVHHRCEGSDILNSLDEILLIAREAGVRTQVSHLKVIGMKNQGLVDKVLKKLEDYDAGFDQYTYVFGCTSLESLLPPFLLQLPKKQRLLALKDEDIRKRARKEMLNPSSWDSLVDLCSFSNIRILQLPSNPGLEGLNLQEIGERASKDPFETLFDILSNEKSSALMVDITQSQESLRTIMRSEAGVWGTDALYTQGPSHPRSTQATFSLFREYYLKDPAMGLNDLIHRMTGKTALRLGLEDRGFVREGCKADLCVLDLDRIDEKKLSGIDLVLVNGAVQVSHIQGIQEEKALFGPLLSV